MEGHLLFSLSSRYSVHPLWPLHHVHRHREAAGEASGKASPPSPSAPASGVTAPRAVWCPTSGMGSHSHTPAATHRLLTHPQLLEDLDEQLSCTRFEEAAMSHRIRSGGCCWLGKGSMGWIWGPLTPPHRSLHPP